MSASEYSKILQERIHAVMQNQNPTGILDNPRLGIFDYLLPVMIATLDVPPIAIIAKKTNCTKIYNLPIEVS